jgi:hypothetical protein
MMIQSSTKSKKHRKMSTVGFIFKVPELLLGALLYDMSYIAIN